MTAWVAHSHAPGGTGVKSSEVGSCLSAEGRPPTVLLTFTEHLKSLESHVKDTLTETSTLPASHSLTHIQFYTLYFDHFVMQTLARTSVLYQHSPHN